MGGAKNRGKKIFDNPILQDNLRGNKGQKIICQYGALIIWDNGGILRENNKFLEVENRIRRKHMFLVFIVLIVLIVLGFIIVRANNWNKPKILSSVLISALVLGATGFILGFVGPMILTPNANQGPLLGIFLTGPAGFFLGGILGFVIGIIREYSQAKEQLRVLRLVPKVWNWLLWASAILAAAVIVFAIIYIPWYESKYSSIVDNSADLQKRDKSLTQLRARSLSDADIMLLQQFSLLDDLDFAAGYKAVDAKLTDAGLNNLSELNLPKLEQLMLGDCNNITDNGMQFVATIKTLKYLSLAPCPRITDAGLSNLTFSTSLETLDLRGCTSITDRGLGYLSKIKNLKEIMLGGCIKVTITGMEELRKTLPTCKVEKDDREWAMHTK